MAERPLPIIQPTNAHHLGHSGDDFVHFKSMLGCGVAVAAVTLSTAAAAAQTVNFDIPAQSLPAAISAFGRQTSLQIVAPAAGFEKVRSRALSGRMDARVALRRLIAGTGLEIASDTGGVIVLRASGVRSPGSSTGAAASLASAAQAAERRTGEGVIAGQVIDPATGEYLRNAIVEVQAADGRLRTTTSGERGEYRLIGVPAGPAKLRIAYTGYEDRTATVDVRAGETVRYDASLGGTGRAQAGAAQEVVIVAGVLEGDARAIMDQRQSMDIKNNLSTESYGDVADGNPAEFIKYMTGVDTDGTTGSAVNVQLRGLPASMTGVTFNGVGIASADANNGADTSRAFSFEGLSLAGIDSIEISKTTSADVDANSPAGTVNIRTKRAFDRRGRRISMQLSGATHWNMWDKQSRSGPGEGGYDGRKFLPNGLVEYSDTFFNRRLGVVASVSQTNTYIEREQITAGRNYVPTAISPDPLAITTITLLEAPRETARFAASLNMDFKATDNLIFSFVSAFNRSSVWQDSLQPVFTTGARTRGVEGDAAIDITTKQAAATNTLAVSNSATYKINKGVTLSPGVEFRTDRLIVDGNLLYSDSSSDYEPLRKGAVAGFTSTISSRGNFSAQRDNLVHQNWDIRQLSGPDWSDSASFTLSGTPTIRTDNGLYAATRFTGGQANLAWMTQVASVPVVFKTGFKLRNAVYDFDSQGDNYLYRYVGPLSNAELLAAVRSSNQLSYGDTGAMITTLSGSGIYLPSPYKLGSMFLNSPQDWERTQTATQWYNANIGNKRHFEEKTTAAFVMGTAELTPTLKFRAGLRWERTDTMALEFDALSAEEVTAAGYTVSAATGRATTIPGLEYQYLSRPRVERTGNYDFFFPSASLKYQITRGTEVHLGYSRTITRPEVNVLAGVWTVDDVELIVRAPNPNLKPSISDNFSARLAHYFEPVGMVALNFYMNRVKGLFQSQEMTAEEFGNTDPRYAGYTFVTTETVSGDAINIRGVEIEFNHAMTYLPGPLDGLSVRGSFMYNDPDVPIVRVADKVGTLSLSYKKGPVRLYFNSIWTDDKYRSTTPSWFARRLDASVSGAYRIDRNFEAFFSIRNLLTKPLNVMVPGSLATAKDIGDHSAIYVNNGTSGTIGIRIRL